MIEKRDDHERDRIVFAGRIGHEDLGDHYSAADVTVVPSHYEPL